MRLRFLIAFCLTFSVNAHGQMLDLLRSSWNGLGTNKIQFDTLTSTAYLFDDLTAFRYKVTDYWIHFIGRDGKATCHNYPYSIKDDRLFLIDSSSRDTLIRFSRSPNTYVQPELAFDSLQIYLSPGFWIRVRSDRSFLFKYENGTTSGCLGYHSGSLDTPNWEMLNRDVQEALFIDLKNFSECPQQDRYSPDSFNLTFQIRTYCRGEEKNFVGSYSGLHKMRSLAWKYYRCTLDLPSYQSDEFGVSDTLDRVYLPFREEYADQKMKIGYVCTKFYDLTSQLFYYSIDVDNTLRLFYSYNEFPEHKKIAIVLGNQIDSSSDIMVQEYGYAGFIPYARSFVDLSNTRIYFKEFIEPFANNDKINSLPSRARKGIKIARKRKREFKRWKKTELGQFLIQSYESSLKGIDCD